SSNEIGGVKLQVLESDSLMAKSILNDSNYEGLKNESEFINNDIVTNDLVDTRVCPNCGSTDVFKEKISAAVFARGVLFLGFPFLFMSKCYHCFNCTRDFEL